MKGKIKTLVSLGYEYIDLFGLGPKEIDKLYEKEMRLLQQLDIECDEYEQVA